MRVNVNTAVGTPSSPLLSIYVTIYSSGVLASIFAENEFGS
jgi:hypothetical protein